MNNYDFQILQPFEFEMLTRDLLQKREGVILESFTPGRDSGVDLRFATIKGSKAVVQVKRYKDYVSLRANLRKEIEKVKNLSPSRYILSTSVGLTPANKDDIIEMFSPYIVASEDILGRDDLNNLLGLFPEVEKQYYKLWLGSTNVLEDILNKRINTWSELEIETIRKEISTYVKNDSFSKALEVLSKNRYVIISGIPGIGKTTLARMLVYHFLGSGYEEFINLNSIDDAAQKLKENRKQVFFFDDFLGSTYLNPGETRFDSKLVAFIEKIKREDNKIFILSTREYILGQALQVYESFSIRNIEIAKCILDLSSYTEAFRAEILYNHLAEAELPLKYVQALLTNRKYLEIIKHPNYNPRIIETFLCKRFYETISPNDFVDKFLEFFDRPFAVWEHAFQNLEELFRYALLVRFTMGEGPVYMYHWYSACKYFVDGTTTSLQLKLDEHVWRRMLKVIEGTFIISKPNKREFVVRFKNPSVYDFLCDWIHNCVDLKKQVIEHSMFCDQLYSTFSDIGYPKFFGYGRLKVDDSFDDVLTKAILRHCIAPYSCELKEYSDHYSESNINPLKCILKMFSSYKSLFKRNPTLFKELVNMDLLENRCFGIHDRIEILIAMDNEVRQSYDLEYVVGKLLCDLSCLNDYVCILPLLKMTEVGRKALTDENFIQAIEETIEYELETADSCEECDRIRDYISDLSNDISYIDFYVWDSAVDEAKSKFSEEVEYDDYPDDYISRAPTSESYEEMFTSLLSTC